MKKWIAMAVAACLVGSASAAEYSWWGNGFGGNGVDFNSAANWASPWATQATMLPGSNDLTRIQAAIWMSGYPTLSGSATLGGLFLGLDNADHTAGASLTIAASGSLSTVTNAGLAYNPGIQIGWYSDASVTSAGTVDTGFGNTVLGAGDAVNLYGDAVLAITDGSWTTASVEYNSNSVNHIQLDGGVLETWNLFGLHETSQTMDITGGTLIFHSADTNWFGWIKDYGLTGYGSTNLTGYHDGNTWIVTAYGEAPTDTGRGDSLFLFNTNSAGLYAGYWVLAANNGAATPVHAITSYAPFNDAALMPTPNIPMVGDVNGDSVCDVVVRGKNGDSNTIILGRNTGITNIAGTVEGTLSTNIGFSGWQPAPDGNWSLFLNPSPDADFTHYFIADVDGDGHDDAVSVRPTPWDSGATTYFVAYHADAEGLEGHTPTTTWAAGILNPHADWTPIMGDFNGDGAVDAAQQRNSDGLVNGMLSIPGSGLDTTGTGPTFWGSMGGWSPNHVATLVGDINGDGMDDIVQVDDRNSNGTWVWVTGLTGTIDPGAIPAGIEIAQGGATSWASPFTLDANSISATPLLADIDNDGRDDLVLYEEYYTDAAQTNIWGRMIVSLTDDPAGGLFSNGYDFGSWYDFVSLFGADASGMVPMIGNVHPAEEMTYYEAWALGYGLTDMDTTAGLDFDFEGDGLDNLMEYAMGGDPLVDDASTVGPVTASVDTDNYVYVYRRRTDAVERDLAYDLQYRVDLLTGSWTSSGGAFETGTNSISAGFEGVTNTLPITGLDEAFIKMDVIGSF